MNKKIKYGIFVSLMALLYLPLAEQSFSFFKYAPLVHVPHTARYPAFSLHKYFDLSYQDSVNKYVDISFGFRPWLIREYNTFNYRILYTTSAGGVVLGKNNQMFFESYILDYIGQNFVGKKQADEVVRKTVAVQKALKKKNIDLVIIFAPGKASFYPEYIPDRYMKMKKDTTNYTYYSKTLSQSQVNFIDMNGWFKQIKYSSPYPLYSPFGTHWSYYGVAVAVDTIIKYIEKLRAIKLPDFDFSRIPVDNTFRGEDYDIGELLNINFVPKHAPMAYPECRFSSSPASVKPDVLAISDSYWWAILAERVPPQIFKRDVYWDYFKTEYINNRLQPRDIGSLSMRDLKKEIDQRDIILIMAAEANYFQFNFGFIDKAYYIYCATPEERIQYWMDQIRKDPDWMNDLASKANDKNKPLNSLIRANAGWCAQQVCF